MNCKVLICLILASVAGSAYADKLDEERVVRSAYAKLHYSADVEMVRSLVDAPDFDHAYQMGTATIPASSLTISITDVKVGNYSEIENLLFSDLIPPPEQGLALAAGLANNRYFDGDDKSETWIRSIQLQWTPSQLAKVKLSIPVRDAVALDQPGKRYSRFVHYTVRLTFEEQTVTYQSLFLFEPDSDGRSGVRIIDPVVDVTALMTMLTYDPYPEAFIRGLHRSTKAVQNWLKDGTGQCDYDAGKGMCCDLTLLTCRNTR
jgi:hypothetical protein